MSGEAGTEGSLAARLRRLRREGGARSRPAPGPGALDPPRDLEERANEAGSFAERSSSYRLDERHGDWELREAFHAAPDALAAAAPDLSGPGGEPGSAIDLRSAIYLDIETTGLAGGAGTQSFLVGLGSFEPQGFRLRRLFLRGPEEERAMLLEVSRTIGRHPSIVSFFGKPFDRHRLEDKMRVHGLDAPFEGRAHLDLYHPLARLYRAALPDGRLATMERVLCGVRRRADLPGSRAPEAWFDYLAGRPHRLEEVFRHNRDDVLSLVVLAAHLGRTLAESRAGGGPLSGPADARAAALGEALARRGERRQALAWLERALLRGARGARRLELLRAECLRRLRDDRAVAALEALGAGEDETAVLALVSLSKHAEHRLRDPARALACAERALALVPGLPRARSLRGDLEHRAARLRRRIGELGSGTRAP